MREVILYGELAKRFGREHRFEVKTPAEAIRALKANYRGFETFMCTAHERGLGFKVIVGRAPLAAVDQIHAPSGSQDVIRIVPVVAGSKAPWVRIFVGAVLLVAAAVAFIIPGGQQVGFSLGVVGLGLIYGGVKELLSPVPSSQGSDKERKTSYLFSGPVNTAAQGAAVPVGYGRMIVGSVVISAGVETHDD